MKFGHEVQYQSLEVGFMIYLHDSGDQLPEPPENAAFGLGVRDVAVCWYMADDPYVSLHRIRDASDQDDKRIKMLMKVTAPYWVSCNYSRPSA